MPVFLIGGAEKAAELDAKRAIDQGTRLAAVVENAKTGDVYNAPETLKAKVRTLKGMIVVRCRLWVPDTENVAFCLCLQLTIRITRAKRLSQPGENTHTVAIDLFCVFGVVLLMSKRSIFFSR